jgi:S-formylglutathione hydrolase
MEKVNDNLTRISRNHSFGGWQDVYQHYSSFLNCEMNFGVYLPPGAEKHSCPVLYWLSGLTCTEQNFITKAGVQQYAAKYGLIIIAPDTSPRGCNLPNEDDDWDLGTGAGFYVNATQSPWSKHYQMYDYVLSELPLLIENNFPIQKDAQSIFGHSMGGHGALVMALRNPERFASVSAFAPIVATSQVPWGQKAFQAYLGSNRQDWEDYDATCLIQKTRVNLPILIDIGEADPFLEEQLKPDLLIQACAKRNYPLTLRKHPHYDHSYYFISSLIGEHLAYHAQALKVEKKLRKQN